MSAHTKNCASKNFRVTTGKFDECDCRILHELKTQPQYYGSIVDGSKPFECRLNDRDFQEGDVLVLREWNPVMEAYTGNETRRRVTYVLRDFPGVEPGYVVMGLEANDAPTARQRADKLRAAAEWFRDCKTLTLEALPVGFIAALESGAAALLAEASTQSTVTRRGFVDGVLYCYGGCDTKYSDFACDVLLPTPLWNRIAVGPPFDHAQVSVDREGRGGVLCPTCIIQRLAALPECTAVFVDIADRRDRVAWVMSLSSTQKAVLNWGDGYLPPSASE